MTERAQELHATANGQIAELLALISTVDKATLRLRCPGREKLGDGTVAASAQHTADNYRWIAGFVQTSPRLSGAPAGPQNSGHRMPRLLRALGHGPADHGEHGPGVSQHADQYTAHGILIHMAVELPVVVSAPSPQRPHETGPDRHRVTARARLLARAGLAWHAVEATVAIAAGRRQFGRVDRFRGGLADRSARRHHRPLALRGCPR